MRLFMEACVAVGLLVASGAPPAIAQSCGGDAYEQDEGCVLSRTMIQGGSSQSHDFCDDSSDWLAFNACSGRAYTIQTSGLGASADTILDLYAGDCSSALATDDDGGGARASRIVWTAVSNGTYHIRVRQKNGTTGANRGYQVALTGDTSTCGTWVRGYYPGSGFAGTATADGGAIVSGVDFRIAGNAAYFLRTTADGDQRWAKLLEGAGITEWQSLAPTDDGGFFFMDRNNDFSTWIAKFDASGAVLWLKRFASGPSETTGRQIAATVDGGVVLAGRFFDAADYPRGWVMKADAAGSIQWSIQLIFGYAEAKAVTQLRDGGFLVTGDRADVERGVYQLWAARLSATGTIVWQKSIGGLGDDSAPGGVLENPDGSVTIAALTSSFSPAPDSDAVWLVTLDARGDVLWQHRYWASAGAPHLYLGPYLARTAAGGFLVSQLLHDRAWTIETDATGVPIRQSSRTADVGPVVFPFGVSSLPDGGAFLFEYAYYWWDAAIRRVDASGAVASCELSAPAADFSHAATSATVQPLDAPVASLDVQSTSPSFMLTDNLAQQGTPCPCSSDAECDDGNVCNGREYCHPSFSCMPGELVVCDDGDPCTVDSCHPTTGCVSTPLICAAPDACHDADACDTIEGCVYPARPDGTACDDGDAATSEDVCTAGVCSGTVRCDVQPRPKSAGYYKKLCARGVPKPSHSDALTDADAACVGQLTSTFSGITSASEICAVYEKAPGGHDTNGPDCKGCESGEDELMGLALNICRQRVCATQEVDSACGDHDAQHRVPTTVAASLDTADAILSDPARNKTTCGHAACLGKEINNGKGIHHVSLMLARADGAGTRLTWDSPVMDDGSGEASSYTIWRRPLNADDRFVRLAETTGTTWLDATTGPTNWEYEVTFTIGP